MVLQKITVIYYLIQFEIRSNNTKMHGKPTTGGKQFLLNGVWGAGHFDSITKYFNQEFDDFFLTDPNQFVSKHYMESNL
jgi:hypothetical protein